MKISQELNTEIKLILAEGGEEIFDIGNKQYLQVVSCLRDKIFKILLLSEIKPELRVDDVVLKASKLSLQTQEVVDSNKYMISIIERESDSHYIKFTHLDYRNQGIMSYLFKLIDEIYPVKGEWTDRISVLKFLLNKGFDITHTLGCGNIVRVFDDELLNEISEMEINGIDKLPYRIFMKKVN